MVRSSYESSIDYDSWLEQYYQDIVEIIEEKHDIKYDEDDKMHKLYLEAELSRKWEQANTPDEDPRGE